MKDVLLKSRYGDYKAGRILQLEDDEAAAVVSGGIGEYISIPIAEQEVESELPTLEDFSKLGANAQKDLFKGLEIEGDVSNEDKRIALYADFLKVRDGGGE